MNEMRTDPDKYITGKNYGAVLSAIAKNKNLEELASGRGREEREILASATLKIHNDILPEKDRKALADQIRNATTEKQIADALHKIEEKIGRGNLDGEFDTVDSTKKWFEAQKNASNKAEPEKKTDETPKTPVHNYGNVSINIQGNSAQFTVPKNGDKAAVDLKLDIKDNKMTNAQFDEVVQKT